MTQSAHMRSVPKQERGERRMQRLLRWLEHPCHSLRRGPGPRSRRPERHASSDHRARRDSRSKLSSSLPTSPSGTSCAPSAAGCAPPTGTPPVGIRSGAVQGQYLAGCFRPLRVNQSRKPPRARNQLATERFSCLAAGLSPARLASIPPGWNGIRQ